MDLDLLKLRSDTERQQRNYERADKRMLLGLSVGTAVIVIVAAFLTYQSFARNDSTKARFMQQCMEDHKEYECTYLWRSSDRPGPDVIPIPIPIPMK